MDTFEISTGKKRKCPFMENCYRKNPIHFSEMSHPHLEKLVIDRLDETITVPDHIDFECSDRSQLLDQLKVLQMVLKQERERKKGNLINKQYSESTNDISTNSNINSTPSLILNSNNKEKKSEDLKLEMEKKKQGTLLRRENKLKDYDANADLLETNCKSLGGPSKQLLKRNLSESNSNAKKKIKKIDPQKEMKDCSSSSQSSSLNTNSISYAGSSLIDSFVGCNTVAARESLRRQALDKMQKSGFKPCVVEIGNFALKYALSAPYHLFFSRVEQIKETYDQPLTITFPEILDTSLGEIVESLHFNFMVDIGWLCLQYLLAAQPAKMLIFYENRVDSEKLPTNINAIEIPKPSAFGCHHSKISILKYKDNGIRIIISTANLYSDDWENRTQGIWISPHLPPVSKSANSNCGESPTGFKKDFEQYLLSYNQSTLTEWIYTLRKVDCSEINVFFVASIPGSHKGREVSNWGHKRLASILSKNVTLPADSHYWPIVAQSSSIGSLGSNYKNWIQTDIISSMSKGTNSEIKSCSKFQFIYPSIDNFKRSIDCRMAACCFPYTMKTHSKQEWIETYMYQWKANKIARDRAMPHIKSYTRISQDCKKIPWFVLTSANLSKAAWGTFKESNYILNYEAGVVFIPKFITNQATFPLQHQGSSEVPVFPMPYDLPLSRYGPQDKAFVIEFFGSE